MIGNDIIDLQLAKSQSNWHRFGFLEKQFTDQEIKSIEESDNADLLLWRFWTMKESAYKVVSREFNKRFYAPLKFKCSILSEDKGLVVFEDGFYKTDTLTTDQFVYSRVGNSTLQWINCFTELSFLKFVEQKTKLDSIQLKIQKNKIGVPDLYFGNMRVSSKLTKTHHGRFEAIEFY